MSFTDEELDRDWKPNGRRPQSTVARSFSAELMDIFRIDNSLADLDAQVDQRKQELQNRTTELEALEARIKQMEELLKGQQQPPTGSASGHQTRPPVSGVFQQQQQQQGQGQQQQQQQQGLHDKDHSKYGSSRPGTARASQQAVPGALPPTPTESEDGDRERDA